MASVGLVTIVIILLTAIFAHVLASDHSPNANRQLVEIAGQRPGFSKDFLVLPADSVSVCSPITKLLKGCVESDKYLALESYEVKDGLLIAQLYQGKNRFPIEQTFTPLELNNVNLEEAVVNKRFLLGTDRFGRDLLSRILVGARVSLYVGFFSVLLSMLIGIVVGSISGFYGGKIDTALMWLANVLWSLPTILLAMAISFALKGRFSDPKIVVFIAIGLSMWVDVARLVRGQIFSLKEEPYVKAIKGFGASHFRIITKHILPNMIGPLLVIAAANFAAAVLIEAGLSFIGIGIDPPEPSWGGLLSENRAFLFSGDNAFMALLPGIAIMILVISFTVLGNGLRDIFDIKRS